MELLAQTYEAQPVAQLADASKASKAQAIAEALAKEKGIRTPSNEAATSTKALEMPKSIVPDEKVSLGPAAPLLLLFSPLLLVLGDALQKVSCTQRKVLYSSPPPRRGMLRVAALRYCIPIGWQAGRKDFLIPRQLDCLYT